MDMTAGREYESCRQGVDRQASPESVDGTLEMGGARCSRSSSPSSRFHRSLLLGKARRGFAHLLVKKRLTWCDRAASFVAIPAGDSNPFNSACLRCYTGIVPQRRNLGGPRREATERVVLRIGSSGDELPAWTLNISRGGIRLVVEDPVVVGGVYQVVVGDGAPRPATVVWTREEADGQIAGLKFEDVEGGEVPPSLMPHSA